MGKRVSAQKRRDVFLNWGSSMRLSSSCLRLQRPINFYFLLRSFVRNFVQLYLYILYVKPGSCPDRDTWKFCWSAVWSCTNKIWQHYQRTGIWSMPFLFNKATHCRSTPTIKLQSVSLPLTESKMRPETMLTRTSTVITSLVSTRPQSTALRELRRRLAKMKRGSEMGKNSQFIRHSTCWHAQ